MSRVTALWARTLIAAYAAFLVTAATPVRAPAQGRPAVVEGTTQLFIRRGPGTEFPPFATLTGGSQVQVEEIRGSWARVTTASGQVGYVHTRYLKMGEPEATNAPEPEPTATVVEPTSTQPPRRTSRPTSTPRTATPAEEPTATAIDTPETADPTPTPSKVAAVAPPEAIDSSIDVSDSPADMKRLADAVEALSRKFDQRLPVPNGIGTSVIEPATGVSGGAILLGLLGVVIGWVLGATYQRNKERGRRSRIRL